MGSLKKYLIVMTGPTGVGKTSLSLKLAAHFHIPIISADSRQIYKELNIGTDKVPKDVRTQVKHYFIDKLKLEDEYSAGQYEREALELIDRLFKNEKILLMTGGTGFYLNAVLKGLDQFPPVSQEIKIKWQQTFEKEGIEALQVALLGKDPAYYATVDLMNSRRLIRALSVIEAGKKPFSYWLVQHNKERKFESIPILLEMDRKLLYQNINTRVDHMMESGLLDEAKTLYPKRELKSLQTVGYQELFKYFDGIYSLEDAIDKIKINSRRYAKRQMTWFRKYDEWTKFEPTNTEEVIQFILSKIES